MNRKTALVATVVTAAVAVSAASAKPKPAPYIPNSRADVQAVVNQMVKLHPYTQYVAHDASGASFACAMYDDAPTKKSQDRSALVMYCVRLTSAKPSAKTDPAS